MNKNMMWVLVIVALLVGAFGGYYYEKTKLTNMMAALQASYQQQLNSAKQTQTTTPTTAQNQVVTMATNAKFGSIVTAANGMTLYTFDKDTKDTSNCTGACLKIWPAYLVSGAVPSPLPAHLGTFQRSDLTTQYAWDGKPLYFYSGDTKAGDVTGDGVGGVWHVAK